MTRIIAGFAGSLTLAVPRSGTRPTSDRVREAIFSALASRDALHGARVADLYAGSGALGLEAASRGAASVVLVERAAIAVRACRQNAARVLQNAPADARPDITVSPKAVTTFLETSTVEWDLVFLDPPYELDAAELTKALTALAGRLALGAIVMVERASKHAEPTWPAHLSLTAHRSYGDTTLWWLESSSNQAAT